MTKLVDDPPRRKRAKPVRLRSRATLDSDAAILAAGQEKLLRARERLGIPRDTRTRDRASAGANAGTDAVENAPPSSGNGACSPAALDPSMPTRLSAGSGFVRHESDTRTPDA